MAPETPPPGRTSGDSPVELLLLLGRRRRLVVGLPAAASLVALLVSLLLPRWYDGTTRILPPQQSQGGAAALLGQLGGLGGLGGLAGAVGGGLGLKSPADLYIGMLKSDTVADALIARFGLQAAYDEKYRVDTRKELAKHTRITSEKSGIITIQVEARDPGVAAEMANAYVEELHRLTSSLAVTEAAQRRVFFERQLQQTKERLADAEVKLRQAIEAGGLVSVDAQSRATVETVARLRATLSAKEIQLDAMRAYATEGNPDRLRVEQELGSMRRELARLEQGSGAALREAPTVEGGKAGGGGVGNIRLLREVKYQEVLFELMAKQYELARVEEAKEAPLVQVLDRAVTPEKKSRPRRALIVVAAAAAALLLSTLLAVALAELERARQDPARAERLAQLRQTWLAPRRPK